MTSTLRSIYNKLYKHFGPQAWWPADDPWEVIVGAILTQNTSWVNVERALDNLKVKKVLSPGKLYRLPEKKLAAIIVPAGYYNIKAHRLKNFLEYLFSRYGGDLEKMSVVASPLLREELLLVNGVGPETADAILLYAFQKPVFVVDAYTKRIFLRHKLIAENDGYHTVQFLCMSRLKPDAPLYNEFHALLVRAGKEFCLKRKPRCECCPLGKSQVAK
ncbi:MAG: endonuclease III domain-containing protein [Candidatus Omnitrophota bacterium]